MTISILLTKSTNFVIYTFYNSYIFNKIIFSFSLFSMFISFSFLFFHKVVDDYWYHISLHFFVRIILKKNEWFFKDE